MLCELGIHDAEVVPDDVPLLDIEAKRGEFRLIERGKWIEAEFSKSPACEVHVLKVVFHGLGRRSTARQLTDTELIDRLLRCLKRGQEILVGVAEQTIRQLFKSFALRFGQIDLSTDKRAFALKMQA